MFLPIGDSPNPPGTPWVTYLLIAVNVLVFIALWPLGTRPPNPDDAAFVEYVRTIAEEGNLGFNQVRELAGRISAYDLLTFRHGFKPASPSLANIFTSMFLHGGLLHLLGNMLFLWIYGDNVEHRLGRFAYLAAYLGTGAVACLGDGLLRMGSAIPSVGASGAISGVLGFYFLWFPRNRVRVWVFFFPFIVNVMEMRARVVLGFYIVFQNILPLLLAPASVGGVSYGAHLGGFLAGGLAAFLFDRLSLARPEKDVRKRPAAPAAGPGGPVQAFRDALMNGRWDAAAEWYFSAPHSLTRRDVGPWEKIQLGHDLETNGHPRAALAAYQRALGDHPVGPGRAEAHLGAGRVLMGPLDNPTGAYQHLYAALEENPTADEASRARDLLTELAGRMRTLPRGLPN